MNDELYGQSEEYENRLQWLIDHDKIEDSFRWLCDLSRKYPDDYIILADLSYACIDLNRYDKALTYAEKAFKLDRSAWTLKYLAYAMFATRKFAEVIEMLDKYEKDELEEALTADFNDILITKAEAYLALRKFTEAKATIVRHISHRDDDDSEYDRDYITELLKRVTIQEAEPEYEIRREGCLSLTQAYNFDVKYNQLEEKADFQAIYDWLTQLTGEFPNEHYIKLKLSHACLELDKLEEALEYARQAYETLPADPLCSDALIEALWMCGKNEEVVEHATKLIDRGVERIAYCRYGKGIDSAKALIADATFFKASSLFALGKYSEAQTSFYEFRRYDLSGVKHGIEEDEINHLELMLQLLSDTSSN